MILLQNHKDKHYIDIWRVLDFLIYFHYFKLWVCMGQFVHMNTDAHPDQRGEPELEL